jgi:hypothetical protein
MNFTELLEQRMEPHSFTLDDLRTALERIRELEEEVRRLRAGTPLRPSLEVLQRMANGLDPFDRGRFQCAVAALPHETPKLSATVNHNTNMNIGDRLDRARRIEMSGLRVVDAPADPAA